MPHPASAHSYPRHNCIKVGFAITPPENETCKEGQSILRTFFPLASVSSIPPKVTDWPPERRSPTDHFRSRKSASASGDIIKFITSGILREPVVNGSASVESPPLHSSLTCCTTSGRFYDRVNSGIDQTLCTAQDNLSTEPLIVFPFPAPRCYAASQGLLHHCAAHWARHRKHQSSYAPRPAECIRPFSWRSQGCQRVLRMDTQSSRSGGREEVRCDVAFHGLSPTTML
ncbi:hypothetical protein DFH94DRAFT_251049 [Russula ochroleuca]|jgi:hypothetical protein|uniref:Uncharacterized protein n=1 Tax=Russula ochroleuca TaxID=152965 RepID=A0A9P5N2G4_9AGAM|nr:hypothetical protein DFH94DRAFT_251049 [Russula ochroleuca]